MLKLLCKIEYKLQFLIQIHVFLIRYLEVLVIDNKNNINNNKKTICKIIQFSF